MTSTIGPYSPQTAVDDSSAGSVAWSNPTNVLSSNATYATADVADNSSTYYTHFIKVTNFGFSLPVGAIITDIQVVITGYYTRNASGGRVYIKQLCGVKNGVITAPYAPLDGTELTVNTNTTAGYSTGMFGETWTAADINSSNFGIALQLQLTSSSETTSLHAFIDSIRVTIIYTDTTPTAPTGLTRANMDAVDANTFSWTYNGYANGIQGAYQLLIYDASDSSLDYDSGKVTSGEWFRSLPANTLSNNKQYQWKVRCYDSLDQLGPYSDLATFYTSAKPVCAITNPATDGDTVATAIAAVDWTYTDSEAEAQSAYKAELLDNSGGVLEDSGKVSSAALTHTFAYDLVNDVNYSYRVTLWDAKSVASTV